MVITAQMVKELREKTGAGMMDCKKALVENEGNMELSIDWLREKGIAKAAKKSDRIAAEGLCSIELAGNDAVIFELNSETDFVSKNEQFLNLLDTIGKALISTKATSVEAAMDAIYEGKTISAILTDAQATIGEKLTLRRLSFVSVEAGQVIGAYKHMGGRIAVLTLLAGGNEEVAKDVSMHVAASNPKYVNQDSVDQHDIAHEREMFEKEMINELEAETNEKAKEGKMKRIPQIVEGKVKKWLKETCLVEQPFVKNPDVTVEGYVHANSGKVLNFIRFEVGEGIEKAVNNFADEVAAQIRG
jgi:elongation factor Ts